MPNTDHKPPILARALANRASTRNRKPIFYGWAMLAATTLTTMATSPGQSFVVGSFSEAIRADLRISLQEFAAAYMIATFIASLPLTLVGRLSDKLGTRTVMGTVALLLGLACMIIALLAFAVQRLKLQDNIDHYAALVALTVSFFLLRFLGQGALGLVSSHTLAMWFERKLGLAESIRHLGMPLALAVLPAAIVLSIDAIGWKTTYALLGLLVWIIVLPLVALVHVNRPEDLGQHVDNDAFEHTHDTHEEINIELDAPSVGDAGDKHENKEHAADTALHQFTLKEAMRTSAYWIVTASMVLSAAVGTAFVFHTQPMMSDLGLPSEKTAAAVVATLGVVTIITSIPFGYLVDRFRPRYLLAVSGFLLAGACVLYATAASTAHAALMAHASYFILALAQGLLFLLASPIFARYYGRTHHGAIRGSLTTFMVIGTSAGPFVFAAARAITGDFNAIYIASAIVAIILAIWATRLSRPTM
ncbi:MAG: MFS transporter [Phycisphaerales bacterium JB047]